MKVFFTITMLSLCGFAFADAHLHCQSMVYDVHQQKAVDELKINTALTENNTSIELTAELKSVKSKIHVQAQQENGDPAKNRIMMEIILANGQSFWVGGSTKTPVIHLQDESQFDYVNVSCEIVN